MEHGVHLALPSTSCITTSRCSDVTIRAWKYSSSSSSIILYNALFCSQVPQLFSYFEIPFTERQSCSCAMTKLSGLKILQNSASKQLQYHRIVQMALLDTLLHFSQTNEICIKPEKVTQCRSYIVHPYISRCAISGHRLRINFADQVQRT